MSGAPHPPPMQFDRLDCTDRNCQRLHGHSGPHMSRTWDAQAGLEIIDEWGYVDARTVDVSLPMGFR